jgi:hypothetical protein
VAEEREGALSQTRRVRRMVGMAEGLERYYLGDAAWDSFAALFAGELQASPIRDDVLAAVRDGRIAAVIVGSFGSGAVEWLGKPVPALQGETPARCLESPAGPMRLKELLMRMPR